MNATTDDDDLEFTLIFEGPPKTSPSLETASDAQRKEVKEEAIKLQQAGYNINLEGPPKTPPSLETASDAQRQEAKVEAIKLQQAGYCINIVRPAVKLASLAPGAKRYILCIEDDVPLVRILERKLTLDGYQVRTASDYQTIVAELQKRPFPDLILLDVGLPGISGFDLLQKLRKHPTLGSVPVIMLTGRASPEDVLQGMTNGADGYVSKPFQFDALAVAIKTVLGMQ